MPEIQADSQRLELFSKDFPSSLSLRIHNFEQTNDLIKFVKGCEKLIRLSTEYKEWKDYLTSVLQDNYCFITMETMDQVSVEIHHHIPSLFSLVRSVVNKKIDEKESFCSFDICLEAMSIHFCNQVGYVPLVKTLHEKFHNNFLQIPISLVKGDYQTYLNNYGKYLDDEDWNIIDERMLVKTSNCTWSKDNYPGLEQVV